MSSITQPKLPSHARILVVDDEILITTALTRALTGLGYDAEGASTGREALLALQTWPRDVMVLDLALPDMSGVELMQRALRVCPGLLIIVLTGQAELESAIAAVKYHAVDFLLKAATMQQISDSVAAALRGHARRLQERVALRILNEALDAIQGTDGESRTPWAVPLPQILHVPPLLLDMEEQTVVVEGDQPRTHKLTRGEVDVLATLMTRPGRALTVQELAATGSDAEESEDVVRSAVLHHIHRLRAKLEADPGQPCLIRTIRGIGYMYQANRRRGG
jgi:DNA-binding response OmpR family regulator